jgi:oxygen-independent coproporphyrinogen-3 oxidase
MVDFPRAAYIHLPFCRHHCCYCDYPVIARRDDLIPAFVEALDVELSWLEEPRPVDTLYLGGGTPTQLPVEDLQHVIESAQYWFLLQPGYEFTLEANPVDLTGEVLSSLVRWGVTRVVLGVQSFHHDTLALLERDHDAEGIRAACELLQSAGIEISLDLMFAVPGQTIEQWQEDLEKIVELGPQHLSILGLTIEPGTTLHARVIAGELLEVNEDLQRSMYIAAIDRLERAGYEHYEISNFSQPGCRSRQNQAYWDGSGYFAAGPGATRLVNGRRETNYRDTMAYLQKVQSGISPVDETEQLSLEMSARERLVFGLCQLEGIQAESFHVETGYSVSQLMGACLAEFESGGFLAWDQNTLQLTRKGLLVSDSLWPSLLQPV